MTPKPLIGFLLDCVGVVHLTVFSSFCLPETSLYLFTAQRCVALTEGVTAAAEWLAFKERFGCGSGAEAFYPRTDCTPSQHPVRHDS